MTDSPQPQSTARRRRGVSVVCWMTIAAELLFFLADRYDWTSLNERKGWTVLVCVAMAMGILTVLVLVTLLRVFLGRRPQFNLMTMLAFPLTVAIPCGWLAREMQAASAQKNAVEDCYRLRCNVVYDTHADGPGRLFGTSGNSPAPWLYRLLGHDFFHDVVAANLRADEHSPAIARLPTIHTVLANDAPITDAGLECLRHLPNLQWLDLCDAESVTDAGIRHLKNASRLQLLTVTRTKVTDEGLDVLAEMPELRVFIASMTGVSGKTFRHFRNANSLRELHFWANEIDDDALEFLADKDRLEKVDFGFSQITDAGLRQLRNAKSLVSLGLRGTQVTDEGLLIVADFPHLKRLDLFKTALSDESIPVLAQLRELEELYVGETQLTAHGVDRLKDKLPNCTIR